MVRLRGILRLNQTGDIFHFCNTFLLLPHIRCLRDHHPHQQQPWKSGKMAVDSIGIRGLPAEVLSSQIIAESDSDYIPNILECKSKEAILDARQALTPRLINYRLAVAPYDPSCSAPNLNLSPLAGKPTSALRKHNDVFWSV
ncbi:hypothetical protein E2C01_020683 [Portunus trituberculatus]|uniref:Uncharacterized protein n=1 Tax=Portunus trituberculatus TaxID=210409 RepID=A0A5B7E0H4_PORTR|nr:hypothetical protein [Portunus trituberculatus]